LLNFVMPAIAIGAVYIKSITCFGFILLCFSIFVKYTYMDHIINLISSSFLYHNFSGNDIALGRLV